MKEDAATSAEDFLLTERHIAYAFSEEPVAEIPFSGRHVIARHGPCDDGLVAAAMLHHWLAIEGRDNGITRIDVFEHDSTTTRPVGVFLQADGGGAETPEEQGTLWLVDYVPVNKLWLLDAMCAFARIYVVDHHTSAGPAIRAAVAQAIQTLPEGSYAVPSTRYLDASGRKSACIIVRDVMSDRARGMLPADYTCDYFLKFVDAVDRGFTGKMEGHGGTIEEWRVGMQMMRPDTRNAIESFQIVSQMTADAVTKRGREELANPNSEAAKNAAVITAFAKGLDIVRNLDVRVPHKDGMTLLGVVAVFTERWQVISQLGRILCRKHGDPAFIITPGGREPVAGDVAIPRLRVSIRVPTIEEACGMQYPDAATIAGYPQHPDGGGSPEAAGFALTLPEWEALYGPKWW